MSARAYDVVVAGAGPGGSAAAAALARGGARVLLLDRAEFPRDKACGGGLTPRGVAALRRLEIDLASPAFVEVGGLEMNGSGRSSSASFPTTKSWPDAGLVARRSELDAVLLAAALKAGASFRPGVRVSGPIMEDGVCRGVRLAGGADIRASHTIASDGATSVVAKGAGLSPPAGSGFWYAAMRGYFGPVPPRTHGERPVLEFYPLRAASGRWLPAYGWVFPLPGGSANVGVDLPHRPSLPGCPPLREAYASFVERLRRERPGFDGAAPEAPPAGALLPEAMRGFRPGSPGLLAVGDAAGLITPYSGEGIVYALESAEMAAEAILGGRGPSEVVRVYRERLRDAYGFQFSSALAFMKGVRQPALARLAAVLGIRNPRILRAAVRVMAYLIEDDPSSTVCRTYNGSRSAMRRFRRSWET